MWYQTILLKDGGWGTNIFSMFKMEYEICFDYVSLSSALIPRIKIYCSLNTKKFIFSNFDMDALMFYLFTSSFYLIQPL